MKNYFFYHFCFLLSTLLVFAGLCHAQNWKEDFDKICGYTETATTLPTEQIKELIEESDRLLKTMEGLDDPKNKVYIFRLKKCRNFFQYILELREAETDNKNQETSPE